MTETFETLASNVIQKIKSLQKIIKVAQQTITYDYVKLWTDILDYEAEVLGILSAYYKDMKDPEHLSRFTDFLIRTQMANYFDKHVLRLKSLAKGKPNRAALNKEVASYAELTISNNLIHQKKYLCCGSTMVYMPQTSELLCEKCGFSETKFGDVDDDTDTPQPKPKRGSYEPTKHCRRWIQRIQAREVVDIPQEVIQKIKKFSQADRLTGERLTCSTLRDYLHILKCTQYNDHVPLMRKIITGISPPQLTECELQLTYNYFDRVVRIFEEIKPVNKSNCPYHPMFIFKILEQILSGPNNVQRRHKILSCIHLQSRETLISHDRLWKVICQSIPEFTYRPTDRNEYI